MFEFKTATPDEFVAECRELCQPHCVMLAGERWSSAELLVHPLPSICLASPLPVAQTFLSAGFGDFPVPKRSRNTVLESTVNPQTRMSALRR